ncbi:MAG: hypothetical protein J6R89_04845 [Clostridia bacterium]|nr:hypothetical protein [Clostridia bacterium]
MADPKETKENGKVDTCMPIILTEPKEQTVVCDVCGHANPKSAGLCKMCSNYLTV